MDNLLIISVIAGLSLIGVIGMEESFADKELEKQWSDSDKVCGDELCSDIPRTCTSDDHRKPLIPPLTRGIHGPYPRITDTQGNSIGTVEVNQQIGISADLGNGKECEQPYVLIIQIRDDKDGSVIFLEWITGSMMPGIGYSPSVVWIPESSGNYSIQMFVWENMASLFPIFPPATTSLRVDEISFKNELENKHDVMNACNDVGVWLDEFNECESSSITESFENYCNDFDGEYYSCHSGCRHSPDWPQTICAAQCIAVCEFE